MTRYYLHLPNGRVWINKQGTPMSFSKLSDARCYALNFISQFRGKGCFENGEFINVSKSKSDEDAGFSDSTITASVQFSRKHDCWTFSYGDLDLYKGGYYTYALNPDGSLGKLLERNLF